MSPADIKAALERRRTYLNRGIDVELATQQAKAKNINLDPYVLELFSQFNGFQEGALDTESSVRIWSLEEIFEQVKEGRHRVSFADFLMDSNEYTFDLEDSNAPILLDDEETVVAKTLPEFLRLLISGHFDY